MTSHVQPANQPSFEVGYIIAFEDGRQDKFGRFPLMGQDQEQISIFKKLVELEPSIREASYIFGSIRQPQQYIFDAPTIEYGKSDIRTLLRQLARPGIVRR